MSEDDLEAELAAALEEEVSEEETSEEEEAEEASETEDTPEEPQDVEEAEEPEETLTAPEHWTKERQELFGTLEQSVQQVMLDLAKDLESGVNKKFAEVADERKEFEGIADAMRPVEAQLQQAGMTKADGIRTLVNAHQLLQRDPIAGMEQLLSQYGGNQAATMAKKLAEKYGPVEAALDGDADFVDPELRHVKDELDQLKQTLTQQQTAEQQRKQQEATNQIELFSKAVDDDGKPLYPHFEQVREAMGARIVAAAQRGERLRLEDAYTAEVYADPALRETLINAQIAQQAQTLDASRKQANAKKQNASKRPSRQAPPPSKPVNDLTLEQEITANLDNALVN